MMSHSSAGNREKCIEKLKILLHDVVTQDDDAELKTKP